MPPKKSLTRERILVTALRITDRHGLDGVSMRRVGAALGVEAMSLYNHIGGKRDLLEGILDLVLSNCAAKAERSDDPVDSARHLAEAIRSALLAHPHVVPLLATRPRETMHVPAVQGIAARGYELGDEIGAGRERMPYIFGVIMSFVVGHVLLETGEFPVADASRPPPAARAHYDADTSFDLGIRAVLAGLTA